MGSPPKWAPLSWSKKEVPKSSISSAVLNGMDMSYCPPLPVSDGAWKVGWCCWDEVGSESSGFTEGSRFCRGGSALGASEGGSCTDSVAPTNAIKEEFPTSVDIEREGEGGGEEKETKERIKLGK